jgi:hypothetical protein
MHVGGGVLDLSQKGVARMSFVDVAGRAVIRVCVRACSSMKMSARTQLLASEYRPSPHAR